MIKTGSNLELEYFTIAIDTRIAELEAEKRHRQANFDYNKKAVQKFNEFFKVLFPVLENSGIEVTVENVVTGAVHLPVKITDNKGTFIEFEYYCFGGGDGRLYNKADRNICYNKELKDFQRLVTDLMEKFFPDRKKEINDEVLGRITEDKTT